MSKYWTYNSPVSNYVTTRQRDIPGCVPAVDVYVGISREDVIKHDREYQVVWDAYRNGDIGFNEWVNHPIHKRRPLSPFKNPSPKGVGSYYSS